MRLIEKATIQFNEIFFKSDGRELAGNGIGVEESDCILIRKKSNKERSYCQLNIFLVKDKKILEPPFEIFFHCPYWRVSKMLDGEIIKNREYHTKKIKVTYYDECPLSLRLFINYLLKK